jgi:predicted O-methyltransferase YrrM
MKILENVNKILVNGRWSRKVILCFVWFFASLAARAGIKLRQEANRCNSIKDYVNLAFNFLDTFSLSITPAQVKEEITELLKLLTKNRPTFVLEIGTAKGGTLFLLARVSSSDAVIISIDLQQGEFGGGYPIWKIPLYKSFAVHQQKMYLIREDSHATPTLDMIERILQEHKLDFLFIDGDHTYEGVKKDFQMYSPLVRKGGLIAFHDICKGPPESAGEANKFWNEIKYAYAHQEIIGSHYQIAYGIGVLYT